MSTHGRYVLAQSGGGWEVRERVDMRRRARWVVGGALLGAAAMLWDRTRHPFAMAFAVLGAIQILSGLRTRSRCLVIRDADVAWGYAGADPAGFARWPRSRIAGVVVERTSRLADPKLRRRQPAWEVRIRDRDGEIHPASFAFLSEPTAISLAENLARNLGVPLEAAEAGRASGHALTRGNRERDRPESRGTEPRPGRLDPR
jgi:hypothetical protein